MMWTVIIIVAIIVVLMLVFKFKEIRHKAGLLFLAGILIFLFLSFMQVYTSSDVDLTSFDGVTKVTQLYFSWLGSLFHNSAKVVGYAINQNWGVNVTNSSLGK